MDTVGLTDPDLQTLINGILQIFNFFAAASAAFLVDRLGRRTLFLISGAGMLVSFVVWTACSAVFAKSASAAAGLTVVVFIFVYFYFYGKSNAVMTVFWAVLTTRRYCLHSAPFRIPNGDLPLLTPSQGIDSGDAFDLWQLGDLVVR